MRFTLVPTRSGALALADAESGEVMHPGLGPAGEAEQLHLAGSRLRERMARGGEPLVVFDVGLGAGSNAAAAIACAGGAGRPLTVWSFERDLAAFRFALANPGALPLPRGAARLVDEGRVEGDGWEWRLAHGDAQDALARPPAAAEVLFWDPFSRAANPRLWTVQAFAAARAAARADAVLTTYSSSTPVRTAMLLAGWAVGEGPALEAGRATTVAAADSALLADPLDHRFLARVARSTAPWPADAPPDARARLAAMRQLMQSGCGSAARDATVTHGRARGAKGRG